MFLIIVCRYSLKHKLLWALLCLELIISPNLSLTYSSSPFSGLLSTLASLDSSGCPSRGFARKYRPKAKFAAIVQFLYNLISLWLFTETLQPRPNVALLHPVTISHIQGLYYHFVLHWALHYYCVFCLVAIY